MTMGEAKLYGERARQLFLEGYNCSQAVVGAFCGQMDLNPSQAMRMASSFGGGIGRMREVCGCFSGACMVAGYLYGYDDPGEYNKKKELYGRIQALAEEFRRENGSIICRELLGIEGKDTSFAPSKRTQNYYKKRPCPALVEYTAQMLAEYIEKNPPHS